MRLACLWKQSNWRLIKHDKTLNTSSCVTSCNSSHFLYPFSRTLPLVEPIGRHEPAFDQIDCRYRSRDGIYMSHAISTQGSKRVRALALLNQLKIDLSGTA